jgi:hypothetical protein
MRGGRPGMGHPRQPHQPGANPYQVPNQGNISPEHYIPPAPDGKISLAYYEIFMLVFVGLFLVNCLLGKKTNEDIANRWYRVNQKFFEENYAHIGAGTEYNPKTCAPIIRDSYNGFKFYASGRVFTKWMLVNMEVTIFLCYIVT